MYRGSHAVLASFRIDPSRLDEGLEILERVIVPSVKRNDDVVDGYWYEDPTVTGQTSAFVSFTSAKAAEAFAAIVRANRESQWSLGVELVRVDVVVITATT